MTIGPGKALSLFPSRVPIVNQDGTATPEFLRSLAIVYSRVGGALGDMGSDSMILGSPTPAPDLPASSMDLGGALAGQETVLQPMQLAQVVRAVLDAMPMTVGVVDQPAAIEPIAIPQLVPVQSWPVGSYFMSGIGTSPEQLLGYGVWVQIDSGFLVSYKSGDPDFGTAGATGGAKTKAISAHSGTAVADHASHTHIFTQSGNDAVPDLVMVDVTGAGVAASGTTQGPGAALTHSVTQPSNHTDLNVLPPYLVVYVWRRDA